MQKKSASLHLTSIIFIGFTRSDFLSYKSRHLGSKMVARDTLGSNGAVDKKGKD
jgi:hypothetical protein